MPSIESLAHSGLSMPPPPSSPSGQPPASERKGGATGSSRERRAATQRTQAAKPVDFDSAGGGQSCQADHRQCRTGNRWQTKTIGLVAGDLAQRRTPAAGGRAWCGQNDVGTSFGSQRGLHLQTRSMHARPVADRRHRHIHLQPENESIRISPWPGLHSDPAG